MGNFSHRRLFSLCEATTALLSAWDTGEDITGGIEMLAWLLYNAGDGQYMNTPTQVDVVDVLHYEVGSSTADLESGHDLPVVAGVLADRLERAVYLRGYAVYVDDRGVVELPASDERATVCATCGRGWDDRVSAVMAPSLHGQCPFGDDPNHEVNP